MSWTYWKFRKIDRHSTGPATGNVYPPAGECFLGLDMEDHKVKVCRRQPDSDPYYGILAVDDDGWTDSAEIVAWAPLATTTAPEMDAVKAAGGYSPARGSREHWQEIWKYWRYTHTKTKKERTRRDAWMTRAREAIAELDSHQSSALLLNG
jgi:hypothetical protein